MGTEVNMGARKRYRPISSVPTCSVPIWASLGTCDEFSAPGHSNPQPTPLKFGWRLRVIGWHPDRTCDAGRSGHRLWSPGLVLFELVGSLWMFA